MKQAKSTIFDGIEKATVLPSFESDAGATTQADSPAPPNPHKEAFEDGRPVSPIFNGTYTITRCTTGEHRTFRVRTQGKDSNFAPGKRVLSLLTGSDNTRDYTGFAFIAYHEGQDETSIWVWRAKQGPVFDGYAKLVRLALIEKHPKALEKYEVLEECRCIMCNRKLTTPESIKAGIGPICAGRE